MGGVQFPKPTLPDDCVGVLRRHNPWWEGAVYARAPAMKRWPFTKILERLEKPLAPIIVLRGPRQVGKSTLQQQVIERLLDEGVSPTRIFRVEFDELPPLKGFTQVPILRIVDWYEDAVLRRHLNDAAHAGEHAFLFFDEVQNLPAWHVQLKTLVDNADVRAFVTGSSALRIERGRDSLAGRIQTLEMGPLRLAEIASLRGLGELVPTQRENNWAEWLEVDFWRGAREAGLRQAAVRDAAFAAFAERGAYPVAHNAPDVTWEELADQLNETVIRRVIQHDLQTANRGRDRDEQLLEEVFHMACRYVGQTPGPVVLAREAERRLGRKASPKMVRHYIDFLDTSLLVRLVRPLEIRLKKRKGYDKLCLCDHALRAAWLQEVIALEALEARPYLDPLTGHLAESVTGYFFASLYGLDVAHFPEREDEPEVDFVLTIGERRIPVEVKYRRVIDPYRDTRGLCAFVEKSLNNAIFGLLITLDDETTVFDPRIVSLPLKSLLMVR